MIFEMYLIGFALCLATMKIYNVSTKDELDKINIEIALVISLGSWISVFIL